MRLATLCFPIRDGRILLGMKKIGAGTGNWNGFGGKLESNESVEQAAVRELLEECGLKGSTLEKKAVIDFTFPYKPAWNQQVHIFIVQDWEGNPIETEEMKPQWFSLDGVPYDRMWPTDVIWMKRMLAGETIRGFVTWKEGEQPESYDFKDVKVLDL